MGTQSDVFRAFNGGNGHSEKFPARVDESFEQRIHACDLKNQQLLAKTEAAQRKHMEFLEALDRRWQGVEDLSLGSAVERLATALQEVQPLRSIGELSAGALAKAHSGHQHVPSALDGKRQQLGGHDNSQSWRPSAQASDAQLRQPKARPASSDNRQTPGTNSAKQKLLLAS